MVLLCHPHCAWAGPAHGFTFLGHKSILKNRHHQSLRITTQRMRNAKRKDTNNSHGKPPKCPLFSSLRRTSGFVVVKREIWIKWFVISFICICTGRFSKPAVSKKVFLAEENRLNRTSSAATTPSTTLCFSQQSPPPTGCPKTLGRMSNWSEGCLHGFVCHPSPVMRALSLPLGLVWRKRRGLFLHPQ